VRELRLAPSLLLAAGILISTYLAVHALPASTLAAPLLLAMTVIGASVVDAAARDRRVRPSIVALIVALIIPAAWLFMDGCEPRVLAAMLPSFGMAGWAALLPASPRRTCCNLNY
jgi:hypothetical protein